MKVEQRASKQREISISPIASTSFLKGTKTRFLRFEANVGTLGGALFLSVDEMVHPNRDVYFIDKCIFKDNDATNGGGMYVASSQTSLADQTLNARMKLVKVTGSKFFRNRSFSIENASFLIVSTGRNMEEAVSSFMERASKWRILQFLITE